MSRTRLLVLGTIVLLAFSGMSQAQIAAPVLTPGTVDLTGGNPGFVVDPTFVPANPSVMSWNGSSVFGLGQARTERDPQGTGKTTEYGSTYAGLRWTGEKFAIGVETAGLKSETSGTDFTVSSTTGGVSGKLADWFSLGVSLGTAKVENKPSAGGGSTDNFSGWTVGGTARLGEVFYVGLGMGRDSVDHKETANNYNDDRSTSQYGLGLYTGGGKGGNAGGSAVWHLEYSVEEKDDFEDAAGNNISGYTRTTGTIEVIWKSILLSYASYSVAAKTGSTTLDGSAVEVGWVSDKSFYVTVRVQKSSEGGSDTDNPAKADANTQAINIGLQF